MRYSAPAKINLSLKIVGRREDGFHELETLVLPLPGLSDTLIFHPADEFSLSCETPGVPTDESNLVSKALRIFERETGLACPYQVQLTKEIPHGAGLGGGSSDAATTLLALNELTNANVPLDSLAAWAAELGSDIPLFLYQSPCWGRGRGEIIEPIELTWSHAIVLFKPAFDISTPWAYSCWKESRELPEISYAPQEIAGITLSNDLERPVFQKHYFLAELKMFLLKHPGTLGAVMSGSGSTVFAILKSPDDAQALIKETRQEMDPTLWSHSEVRFIS